MKGNSNNNNNNNNSGSSQSYVLVAAIATLATASVIAVLYTTSLMREASNNENDGIVSSKGGSSESVVEPAEKSVEQGKEEEVRVAFVGNSMLYFNDSPRFLTYISRGRIVEQDSCLRGGASLISILDKGNGMSTKFRTPNAAQIAAQHQNQHQHDANHDNNNNNVTYDIGSPTVQSLLQSKKWDYVILNDYTQSPARSTDREATIQVLKSQYVPLLQRQQQSGNNNSDDTPIIPILLMTPAYRKPVKNSQDLGTVHDFTMKLKTGYDLYAEAFAQSLQQQQHQQSLLPKVAPWGIAYQLIHDENYEFWYTKLFHTDDFHPSPHGTFLRDVILYCTIFDELPDEQFVFALRNNVNDNDGNNDNNDGTIGQLWDEAKCRVMQPAQDEPLKRPTRSEAEYLWDVARRVCFEKGKQP